MDRSRNALNRNDLFAHFEALGEQTRHLNDGGVEDVEKKLRRNPDREHQERDRDDDELLAAHKIGETTAAFGKRSAEERLHRAHESHGREKEAEHSDGGKGGNGRK